jgi:transaldolase
MNIFLDTANIDEIKQAVDWGVLDGVTTNPTHIAKSGRPHHQVIEEICGLVNGPISAETTSLKADGIIAEAHDLAAIHPNVIVKVPLMKEGLKAVKLLAEEGIRCNVTVTFTPLQALLAAKVGAYFVSPFIDRLNRIGEDGFEIVPKIRKIFDNYRFTTKLLVASVRSPLTVMQAALVGADICTMPFEVLTMLYNHPLTEQGIDIFLKDAAKIPAETKAPAKSAAVPEALKMTPYSPPVVSTEPVKAAQAHADLAKSTPPPLHVTPSKTPPAFIMRPGSRSGPPGAAESGTGSGS